MKRFQFQLESVLNYKQEVLDARMVELAAAQEQVLRQTEVCEAAHRRIVEYDRETGRMRREGCTVLEAQERESCMKTLERRAKQEDAELEQLREIEEEKRSQVVEARRETLSLEKLKEIRHKEYDAAAAKAEEQFIDDLTAAKYAAGNPT